MLAKIKSITKKKFKLAWSTLKNQKYLKLLFRRKNYLGAIISRYKSGKINQLYL